MIHHMIYTQATKDKVIKPSQWKDDMRITLYWACPNCGHRYIQCRCEDEFGNQFYDGNAGLIGPGFMPVHPGDI